MFRKCVCVDVKSIIKTLIYKYELYHKSKEKTFNLTIIYMKCFFNLFWLFFQENSIVRVESVFLRTVSSSSSTSEIIEFKFFKLFFRKQKKSFELKSFQLKTRQVFCQKKVIPEMEKGLHGFCKNFKVEKDQQKVEQNSQSKKSYFAFPWNEAQNEHYKVKFLKCVSRWFC